MLNNILKHISGPNEKWIPFIKIKRAKTIISNSINNLIVPVFTISLSFVVTRWHSQTLWGEYVSVTLWVNLFSTIIAWGNKEYLLRKFSLDPKRIGTTWSLNFKTRLLLFLCSLPLFLLFTWNLNTLSFAAFLLLAKYITQSFDVLIVYQRKFSQKAFLELSLGILLIGCLFVLPISFHLTHLLLLSVVFELLKGAILFLVFRKEIEGFSRLNIDVTSLLASFPFFLISLTGMLFSKMDMLYASYIFSPAELAQYNVLINFLLLIQASSNFIFHPFVKNFYRMNVSGAKKISYQLLICGMFIGGTAMLLLHALIPLIYPFHYDCAALWLGFLMVLPIFYCLPIVYRLYKLNWQYHILAINTAGFVLNLLLCVLLIPKFEGINGALFSVTITQWLILIVCLYIDKKWIHYAFSKTPIIDFTE